MRVKISLVSALAITIGTVSGIWMVIAWALGETGVVALMAPAWAAFVGMPLYFASGGGAKNLGTTFTGLAGGVLMSMVMFGIGDLLSAIPEPLPIAIGVGVGSWIVVSYSRISWIPYVPGGFAGAASSFAFGSAAYEWSMAVALIIALFSGAFLGYVADVLGHAWAKDGHAEPVNPEVALGGECDPDEAILTGECRTTD